MRGKMLAGDGNIGEVGTDRDDARIEDLRASRQTEPVAARAGGAGTPHAHAIGRRIFTAVRCHLPRSEEHTSELQSLMRISYAVFCLKKKKNTVHITKRTETINVDEISNSRLASTDRCYK